MSRINYFVYFLNLENVCEIIHFSNPFIISIKKNESNEELKMKQCLYLHTSFPFFVCLFCQDYATKAEIHLSYYHLSSEDQNKKNVSLDWQKTDSVDTGCGW